MECLVPAGKAQVGEADGWVTLSGEVEWEYQSTAAEVALRNLVGIKGLFNLVQIRPGVELRDVTRTSKPRCAGPRRTTPGGFSSR